jgi:hypothetical protein
VRSPHIRDGNIKKEENRRELSALGEYNFL